MNFHPEGKKSCKACCGPDNANFVKRSRRTDTAPNIHYGTTGSADSVMKNGILRDQWASTESILCFEMETAGKLRRQFNILVNELGSRLDGFISVPHHPRNLRLSLSGRFILKDFLAVPRARRLRSRLKQESSFILGQHSYYHT